MTENIVEISGHQYRYEYDQDTQKTLYRGPVGDGPALSESEFQRAVLGFEEKEEQLEEFMRQLVKKEGKFTKDMFSAHYIEPEQNIFASDGIVCRNCDFFLRKSGRCAIVEDGINGGASCRFWNIPREKFLEARARQVKSKPRK